MNDKHSICQLRSKTQMGDTERQRFTTIWKTRKTMFQSDRIFKLWDYSVSHQQLLIRSPQTTSIDTNIDIIFWGVEALSLLSTFHGITLKKNDRQNTETELLYSIQSDNQEFKIIAANCGVYENKLDIFESTLNNFQKDPVPGTELWR